MHFSFQPYELQLKHTFTVAGSTRNTTPVVLTRIEYEGITGYGEASLPPYLGETQRSVMNFFRKVDLKRFDNPFELDSILSYIDSIAENNTAAKAAIDIALHDIVGKIMGKPWYAIWGLNSNNAPSTSFTIGIDSLTKVVEKTIEAAPLFNILKIKLGNSNDRRIIAAVRSVTDKPLAIDVNQGWNDKHAALEMIHWLNEQRTVLVEQPMPKNRLDDIAWITERSPLPIIADESFQRLTDLVRIKGAFHGINIKLMKCSGMREAWKIVTVARALGMMVMVGCMTETSCAVSAASHLSPAADFADLDGNLLITNDIYKGVSVVNGKLQLPNLPGIGLSVSKGGDLSRL
jgi:L-alanine-DL-glutamate epimerase-like enolase superfamily enzyme